jgi:hypothetical protein
VKLFSKDTLRIDAPFALGAITATLGAAALAAAPYVLDRGPTAQQQQDTISERRTLAAEREKALAKQQSDRDALRDRSKEAIQLLPASALNARMSELTTLATECSASITQMAAQPALPPVTIVGKDKAVIVPIKLAGSSTYEGATRFLNAIRTRFRDTAITGLHLSAAPADASPTAGYTIDLAWYTASANSVVSADPAAKAP